MELCHGRPAVPVLFIDLHFFFGVVLFFTVSVFVHHKSNILHPLARHHRKCMPDRCSRPFSSRYIAVFDRHKSRFHLDNVFFRHLVFLAIRASLYHKKGIGCFTCSMVVMVFAVIKFIRFTYIHIRLLITGFISFSVSCA